MVLDNSRGPLPDSKDFEEKSAERKWGVNPRVEVFPKKNEKIRKVKKGPDR